MKNNRGFTLIELVVVIVILGILAAVALPRFIDTTEDAHEAAIKGVAGGLASAVLLARAQYELNRNGGSNSNGCTSSNTCQINLGGFGDGSVDVNANGWPVGTDRSGTPGAGAGMSSGTCNEVFRGVLQGSAPSVGTGSTVDYLTSASGTTCTFTYQKDGKGSFISYNANNGEVQYTIN